MSAARLINTNEVNITWRKSSRSHGNNTNCVEVGVCKPLVVEVDADDRTWAKAQASGVGNTSCVEAAIAETQVMVRDSKHRAGGRLNTSWSTWSALIQHVSAR